MDWLVAGTYCEEEYGMSLNTEEGYFVCLSAVNPCMKMIGSVTTGETCPICGFEFMED